MKRILALVAKDFAELRTEPGDLRPGAADRRGRDCLSVRHRRHHSGGHRRALSPTRATSRLPNCSTGPSRPFGLSAEGAIQAFIFQQALALLVGITTVTGGMSVAAHSVIGEKQARTLEPLLATPLRTGELLAAKVISAAIPGVVLTIGVSWSCRAHRDLRRARVSGRLC